MSKWNNYNDTHKYIDSKTINILQDKLINFLNDFKIKYKNIQALEIGSGHGIYTILISKIFKNILATEPNKKLFDLLEKKIKLDKIKNVSLLQKKAETIVLQQTFNMIVCFNVFVYINDKRNILLHFYKLLKPNGYILIMDPIDFLKYESNNNLLKEKQLMQKTNKIIYKSQKFNVIYYGIIFKGMIGYLLQKK